MQVAIYIRWSTEDQGEGTTLDVQMEACQAFARSQGWDVSPAQVYVDDGVSGGTLDRPALTRLRAAVTSGLVDCVVVYKLDRLSRSVVDMVRLVLDEWEGHCCIKSAREPIDTLTQTGRLFFYQLMSFAEWERSVIRERTFAGKLRRAQEGKNPGITAAYGYRLGASGLPEAVADEAGVVQLIFRLYLSGMGCTQIARELERLGHPSPAGRRWGSGQISRLLSNPIYMGTLVYGKQRTSKGRKVRSDRPHVVREGAVTAIVAREAFEAVQALKARRPGVGRAQGSGRSLSSQSLLAGVLRCACGHAYCGSGGTGPRQKYRYYCCAGARCGAGRLRQADLDGLVLEALAARLAEFSGGLAERIASHLGREQEEAGAALRAAERDLARVAGKEARLQSLLLEGQISAAEYRELRAGLAAQLAEVTGRHSAALQRLAALEAAAPAAVLPPWEALDPLEQKRLVGQFVAAVTAYRDRAAGSLALDITWRLPEPDVAAGGGSDA